MLPTLTPRDAAARGPFGSPQPGSSPETFFLACFFFSPPFLHHPTAHPSPLHPLTQLRSAAASPVSGRFGGRELSLLSPLWSGDSVVLQRSKERGKDSTCCPSFPSQASKSPEGRGSMPCRFGSPSAATRHVRICIHAHISTCIYAACKCNAKPGA